MKWLAAAAAVVVIGLGVLLWQATRDGEAKPADDPSPLPRPTAAIDAAPSVATPTTDAAPPPIDGEPGVFVVKSEEFWDRVDELPRQLPSYVADCYKGGQERKAKLKVSYQLSITNHVVTLRDIKVVESTLTDPALQQCMIRSLEAVRFDDREMPDYLSPSTDPEVLMIRIEALKRFYPSQDEGNR
jgi:hypothetical protein